MHLIRTEWIKADDAPNANTNPLPNLAIGNKSVNMIIDDSKRDKKRGKGTMSKLLCIMRFSRVLADG